MAITRLRVSEQSRSEEVSWQLEALLATMSMLLLDASCADHGLTRWISQELKKTVLVYVKREAKLVGTRSGVPRETLQRCNQRMACWVRLYI